VSTGLSPFEENTGPHALPPPSWEKASPVLREGNVRYIHTAPPRSDVVESEEWSTAGSVGTGPEHSSDDREGAPTGSVVIVKPYWAIASICLAVGMLTALVCLWSTTELDFLTAAFMAVFGVGLATSSFGLLVTTPRYRPDGK
jgi:hypothetical protein